jgi:putative holliday junction resolvase
VSKRTLGIDYGKARLGIALSDPRKIIASPLENVKAAKTLEMTAQAVYERIQKLEGEGKNIDEIVVGKPIKMNGTMGVVGEEIERFVQYLEEKTALSIVLWDERLTTVQAERSMREDGCNRKRRAKSIDSVAAVIILQSYIDSLGNTF